MSNPCCPKNGLCPQHKQMKKAAKGSKWRFESQRGHKCEDKPKRRRNR